MTALSDVVKDMKKSKKEQKGEPTDKIIRDDWQQPLVFYFVRIIWIFLIAVAACSAVFLALLFAGRI